MLSKEIQGRNHRLTTSLSARRERMGVTEMGLKSDNEVGLGHFGIGVTIEVCQFEGTRYYRNIKNMS